MRRSSCWWRPSLRSRAATDKETHDGSNPTHPIPADYRRVTPSLVVEGAAKALEFYAEVFGATERMRIPGPGGTIAHSEVEIGD